MTNDGPSYYRSVSSVLDTLTPVFELYARLRERRQREVTCACRELRPKSLEVPGMNLQLCGLQVWCWLISTVLWLVLVERKLDLSSVTARLRGSSCVVLSGLDTGVMNQ
ncbi:hypothetical protein Taro_038507 [Colocasia esculenta]|uniref:Uncharacterized protein n=1 Tax=Colocasia esculenta TaxID=4460 RepID=A0A843W6V9_COLES|nr:hypothetical protein [Colocasia esculenta]